MRIASSRTVFACAALILPKGALAGPPWFENVAESAGVSFLHWDWDQCRQMCLGMTAMVGGAAAGDFDGDGWVDLYVTRLEASNLLFHNRGDGTFEEVAAAAGVGLDAFSSGCAWGDVDNDRDLDLLVLTLTQQNYLFVNQGDGTFLDGSLAAGLTMQAFTPKNWTSAAFGDFDLDGDLDLHVVGWHESGRLNRLYVNAGDGRFIDATDASGLAAPGMMGFAGGFADLDDDGWPDLLVAADFKTSRLFRNLRNRTFADVTREVGVGTDENGMGSSIADYDNDGDFDWFVSAIYDPNLVCTPTVCNVGWGGSGNRLYENDGTGHFADATAAAGVRDGAWGWGAAFFDYDNDGDLDLGMTNGQNFPWTTAEDKFHNQPKWLWDNDGAGVMAEVGASRGFNDTGSGKGFLVFDFDRDGDMDMFIVNHAGYPVLYRNHRGSENRWLQVELRGSTTNRLGLGGSYAFRPRRVDRRRLARSPPTATSCRRTKPSRISD